MGPVSTPGYDYWSGDPGDSGQDAVDSSAGGGEGMAGAGDEGSFYNSGGRVAMQEGGPAPQMPMPQQPQAQAQPQGVQGDIENLGMINEQAAAPQKRWSTISKR